MMHKGRPGIGLRNDNRIKPSPMVLVEGNYGRCHSLRMLTSEDHRQIAERCIRLAKSTEPRVAEQLLTFAANHLEKAELALRFPAICSRATIRLVQPK